MHPETPDQPMERMAAGDTSCQSGRAGGMTHQELLDEFPDLTEEDIRPCLAFAADRERRLAILPA